MAKKTAGVLALSLAALLFAGCGGGSKLSPAQKERCDQLEKATTKAEELMRDPNVDASSKNGLITVIEKNRKERASLGC